MNINKARAIAQHGAMTRSFNSTERYMKPFKMRMEPAPKREDEFVPMNSLVCVHKHLAWDACRQCNRTKENALEQTKKLRERLGVV